MPKTRLKHHSNHKQMRFTYLAICLLALLLGACSTTVDKMDKLNQTLRAYEKTLRWAKFDAAYSFHKWGENEQPSIPAHLKDIRLSGYDVGNSGFDQNNMTATQTVFIRYYNQNNYRERSLEDKQEWKYFPDLKRWYLTTKPPTFQ